MKKPVIFLLASVFALGLASCSPAQSTNEPYIGENGNWWVNGSDTGHSATGEPGKDGSDGKPGEDGKTPTIEIGDNGNWWIDGVDTGVSATGEPGKDGSQGKPGEPGKTPTIEIGDNGNWWIDGVDTGVSATGNPGENGKTPTIEINEDGIWVINGNSTGVSATGKDGNGIVSIKKVSSDGDVDTYVVTFSDGGTFSFEVTNGSTTKIESISFLKEQDGEYVYEVRLSDGSCYEFRLPIPEDGQTPYIGENGNWWIGENDTGVLADPTADGRDPISDGLDFVVTSVNGTAGMVVSGYRGSDVDVVIPNYVGLVPVIGIYREAFEENDEIRSVSLSKNTIYLEERVFSGCSGLSRVDFNECELEEIPAYAFQNTAIVEIELSPSIEKIGDYAFQYDEITSINYENVKRFGASCLRSSTMLYYYLDDEVEEIGSYAFGDNFVYIEAASKKDTFDHVTGDDEHYVAYGCYKADGYIVSDSEDGGLIVYQAPESVHGNVRIPASIGGKDVSVVGRGFGSVSPAIELDDSYANGGRRYNSVFVPEGVKKTELYSLFAERVFIHLPSTMEMYFPTELSFYQTTFAGDSLPQINSDYSQEEAEEILAPLVGISESDLVYDDESNSYFLSDGLSLKLISFLGNGETEPVIPSSVGTRLVSTIGKYSFFAWSEIKALRIENGIKKIEANGIKASNVEMLSIPSSMADMNADAIYCRGNVFAAAASKPDDWDTNWFDGSGQVNYGYDIESFGRYLIFDYAIKSDGSIILISVDEPKSRALYVPSEIDGNVVNEIYRDFATDHIWYTSVYLPSSIEKIGNNAFTINSSCHLYYEGSALRDGWTDGPIYLYSTNYVTYGHSLVGSGLDDDSGIVYQNGKLLAYYGSKTEIMLPRQIGGKTVDSIGEGFLYDSESSSLPYSIFVPDSVATIEYHSFYLSQADSRIYLEVTSKPDGYESEFAYIYGSSYSDNLIYGYELGY